MGVGYYEVIKKISEQYSERGWSSLNFEEIRDGLSPQQAKIVYSVVNAFLSECSGCSSKRIFGRFPEEDIRNLAKKCTELEKNNY